MSRPRGTASSGEANKHPYLRAAYYEELFGHLEKPTSSPEWLARMAAQRELIQKNKRYDKITLTRLHQ